MIKRKNKESLLFICCRSIFRYTSWKLAMTTWIPRRVMNDLMRRLTNTYEEVTGQSYYESDPMLSVEGLNGFERLKLIIKRKIDLTEKKITDRNDARNFNAPRPRSIRMNNDIYIMIRSIKDDVENLKKLHEANKKRKVP
jgi:hypothetical protein